MSDSNASAPAPQRRWQAACPNCGAPLEFASAASACTICSYCRSSLLREGEALRKIGISAELIEDYSPLQLGASGRYSGQAFTVVGRLQLGYAEGQWNEWHLLFDGSEAVRKSAWLAEDNGSFVLAFDAPLSSPPPPAHALTLGSQQIINGQAWSVAALTPSTLLAAQGELPRPPELQREYLVAELRSAKDEVGTLDYAKPEAPQWSLGRAVRIDDLAMRGLREESSKTLGARQFNCPSCGASLTPKLNGSKSLVCGQCQAVIDISQSAAAELPHYAQTNGREPDIPLGRSGSLAFGDGPLLSWQVVGYQERCDIPDSADDFAEQTFWREYLLFNKREGFVFLVDSEDGWSLVRPLTGAPTQSRALGFTIEWQGKTFKRRYAQSYTAKSTHVLGEFYWQVKRDQRALVSDYECRVGAGKELLSREQTGNEVTWSWGRTLDASVVAKAFGLPLATDAGALSGLGRSIGNSLDGDGGSIPRKVAIALFVLFIIFIIVLSSNSDDCDNTRDTYGENSEEYAQCKRSGGSGARVGGSYGGYGSSGGGHK